LDNQILVSPNDDIIFKDIYAMQQKYNVLKNVSKENIFFCNRYLPSSILYLLYLLVFQLKNNTVRRKKVSGFFLLQNKTLYFFLFLLFHCSSTYVHLKIEKDITRSMCKTTHCINIF